MNNSIHVRDQVSAHDLLWDFVPRSFFEGFMLGNGDLGAVLWFEGDRMVLSLDKADVWERRADQGLEPGMNFRKALRQVREGSFDPRSRLFDRTRPPDRVYGNKLPVGRAEWQLSSPPIGLQGKLSLYDAALRVEVYFEEGALTVWGYLHACENRICLEMETSGGVRMPTCQVRAQCLDEPGQKILKAWGYPAPEYGSKGEDRYAAQVFSGDEKYVIYARSQKTPGDRVRCDLTVVTGRAGEDLAREAAAFLSRRVAFEEHAAWWAAFWSRSQLSVPDPALERLWYIEMYKLGCNARQDGYPVTIMGVWNPDTRIPPCYGDLHHNLETEMNTWPVFASNHLELAAPLYELLVRELPRFEENCRTFFGWDGAYIPANMDICGQGVGFLWFPWNLQVGVGAWLAQHFWLHYLYSGDRVFLRDRAWPFMEAVGRFWLGFLEEDEDGLLHVPWSYSPEYDDILRKGRDSAFDLSLARYLFTLLIEAAGRLGVDPQAVEPHRRALERLAPLPVDETGIQVYAGKPLAYSHRHFSHLMAIHPLGFLNVEGSAEDRALIDRSLAHLRRIGTGHWAGWSFPWAALIACRAGRAGMAHAMLRFYTDHVILPNTFQVSVDWKGTGFYTAEHGLINTLEAGAGAATAVMEMLLQSWGGKIRVFPCVLQGSASFTSLRAEGAFLVSASCRAGAVAWVRIVSEVGNRCVVRNPWGRVAVTLRRLNDGTFLSLEGPELAFETEKGGIYEITGPASGSGRQRAKDEGRFTGLPRWN